MPVERWLTNFEQNAAAYNLSEQQKYVQARGKMTRTAQLYLESVCVSTYEELKTELLKEFKRTFASAEVHIKLSERKKKINETFHEYVLHMKKIAALGEVETESVIRYIVDGLNIRSEFKFNMYSCRSFHDLYEKYEVFEHMHGNERKDKQEHKEVKKSVQTAKAYRCFNCGSADHLRKDCKADTKCFKCNNSGHISKNCPQVSKNVQIVRDGKRCKVITLNNVEIECLVDTGADVTIVKNSVYRRLGHVNLQKSNSVLCGLGNNKTVPIGVFVGTVQVDSIETQHKFVVVPDDVVQFDALLGYDFASKLRLTLDENGFTFTKLSSQTGCDIGNELTVYNVAEHEIEINAPLRFKPLILSLVNGYKPSEANVESPVFLKVVPDGQIKPFRHQPGRHPPVENEAIKTQVDEWLKNGVIRKSTSNFASRVVIVKKKDGTYRVCVDFRQLNSMVLKDCFPVPLIDEVLDKLQAAKVFAVMDLENGFFHVPIEESSRKFTAFITKQGLYEFNKAPFGFCNSPAAFMRFINCVFHDLVAQDVMQLYMDDIIIYAQTTDECIEKLRQVLEVAAEYKLKIKWKKCHFLKSRIDFLGHTVESGKVWPGLEKTRAVRQFATPKNVKAVQSFLGLTGFFRKFIKGYAKIARPLTDLLKKDFPFKIGNAELNAINQLKDVLCREPVLRIYCRDAPTELHTDASKDGFGATLMQKFNGQLHPVLYWSKKTSPSDAKRHSYVLEVKAAYLATEKFRHYLLGTNFTLVTDCAAFTQTVKKRDVPREVARWILYLQDFNFQVEHRAADRLKHVDGLSRYPIVLNVTSEISARIRVAQQKDSFIKAILEVLKNGEYDGFNLKSGVLYKNVNGNNLLVVPKAMEREIINEAHNVGHFAVQKTVHSIQQQFWIPHVERKVEQVVNACIKCIIYNKKIGRQEGYLCCIDKGSQPLHTLHVDHLGPMDVTTKQYKFIFAMVDGFTKFVWLFTTKTTGCDEVLKKLEEWSNVFGLPSRIVSDRGAAFTSNAFTEYVKSNAIEHVLTTTGVARGNGQIERVNRSILSIISKLSAEDSSKWFKFVPQVQRAINSHIHSSSKKSPFELLFGVKIKNKISDKIISALEQEFVDGFDAEREKLREEAKIQIQQAQDVYKYNYDKKRKKDFTYKEVIWLQLNAPNLSPERN